MAPVLVLHNKTPDTLHFQSGMREFHNPPQSIAPDETVEIRYTPNSPTTGRYVSSEGDVVVEAGNDWQGNKVFGEGAYRVHEGSSQTGFPVYEIVKN